MAISPFGIQLLSDTDVFQILYKNTRENAWRAAGKDGSHTVIADGSGNGYTLSSPENLHITNGPTGKAGWDDAAPADLLFARRFYSSLTTDVESAVIDSAVPVAANAAHTVQVCFKWEWNFDSTRGIHAVANNNPGSGIGNDYIDRITGHSDGTLRIFTENNDTNVSGISSINAIRPGLWQFATFVFLVQDATNFDCRIFVHTLEANGTVTGIGGDSLGFDKQVTTLRCNVASGLTDGRIDYGAENLGANDYIGDIALGRFVKEALSDVDADAEAREFLLNGKLANYGSNELYRHEFNEEPDLVDEGVIGCHLWSQGDEYGNDDAPDLVGTGGHIFRTATSSDTTRYVGRTLTAPQSIQTLVSAGQLVRLNDFFNDDLAAIPEWTLMVIGIVLSPTGAGLIYMNQASGESLASNHVVSASIATDGNIGYFAERGSGTNISGVTQVGTWSNSAPERMVPRLYTLRYGDDAGAPGTPILRVSENDQIDVLTRTTSGVPQGGDGNTGLSLAWPAESILQEQAFFSRQLTDQEIIDTHALINFGGSGGGGSEPQFYRMRGFDQTLARDVYWESDEIDTDFSDYTGPGPVVEIVVVTQRNQS